MKKVKIIFEVLVDFDLLVDEDSLRDEWNNNITKLCQQVYEDDGFWWENEEMILVNAEIIEVQDEK